MNKLTGVFLDKGSLDTHDLDFHAITSQFRTWKEYDFTEPSQVLDRTLDCDVVICNKTPLNNSFFNKNTDLKLVCVTATGTNNIDLNAAKINDVAVCNATKYATPSVVQHVFSLIISLHNNLINYTKLIENNAWQSAKHFCLLNYPINELQGKSLGIIGYGELGRAVAETAKAFGLNILIAESLCGNRNENRVSLDVLFQQSDIISLHCPLTEQSHQLINKASLSKMKQTAILINTARGELVNEKDLLTALKEKQISAAGLDVLSSEPPVDNCLLNSPMPNLIITPHIAWASSQSRQRLINQTAENISAFRQNKLRNLVI